MLVCHCKRLSDREIRACARNGAATAEEVGKACGAGTVCGGCVPLVELLVEREQAPAEPRSVALPLFAATG